MSSNEEWLSSGERVVSSASVALVLRQERTDGTHQQRETQRLVLLRGERVILGRPNPQGLAENETQFEWPGRFLPTLDLAAISRELVALQLDRTDVIVSISPRLTTVRGPRLFAVRIGGEPLAASAESAGLLRLPFAEDAAPLTIDLLAPADDVARRVIRLVVTVASTRADGRQTAQRAWDFQGQAIGLVRSGWWERVEQQASGRLIAEAVRASDRAGDDDAAVRAVLRPGHPGESLGAAIRTAVASLVTTPRGMTARDWNRVLRQANLAELYVADPTLELTAADDATRGYEPTKSLDTFLELCRRLRAFGVLDDAGDSAG